MMNCKVLLLDGTDSEFTVDKKATGKVLFDKTCEKLSLLETAYFALTFRESDDTKRWLDNEQKISKQLKDNEWVFSFHVKFYPPEPSVLHEEITRYQLFMQLRVDVLSGKLPCSFVTHALLGSYAAQSQLGDYDTGVYGNGSDYLKEIQFASNQTEELLDKIAELHRTHRGQSPGEAEMNYLDNAKNLAMYGVHMFPAKDSDNQEVVIGVCAAGVVIYKQRLRVNRFSWPRIIKIAYKRNLFFVQPRPGDADPKGTTIEYKLGSLKKAKIVWKLAMEHHAFFRLKEPAKPSRSIFKRFGSRYQYAGKTQYQSQMASDMINRSGPEFDRGLGMHFDGCRSYEDVTKMYSTERMEEYQMDEPRYNTLDLRTLKQGSTNQYADSEVGSTSDRDYATGTLVPTIDPQGKVVYVRRTAPSTSSMGEVFFTGGGNRRGSREDLTNPRDGGRYLPPDQSDYTKWQGQGYGDGGEGGWSPYGGASAGMYNSANRQYGSGSYMPPDQSDQLMQQGQGHGYGGDGNWDPSSSSNSSVRTSTRTYMAPDGTLVTERKTESQNVVQTHVERRTFVPNMEDMDFDKALSDAIRSVTNMNTDLSVEKIEIQAQN